MKFVLMIAGAMTILTPVMAKRNKEQWNGDHTCIRPYQECTDDPGKCCTGYICIPDSLADSPNMRFCRPCSPWREDDSRCSGRELQEEDSDDEEEKKDDDEEDGDDEEMAEVQFTA